MVVVRQPGGQRGHTSLPKVFGSLRRCLLVGEMVDVLGIKITSWVEAGALVTCHDFTDYLLTGSQHVFTRNQVTTHKKYIPAICTHLLNNLKEQKKNHKRKT